VNPTLHFPAVARLLMENGYTRPVPIRPNEKRPANVEWQLYQASEDSNLEQFSGFGTGLICDGFVGVDIDCYAPEIAEQLRDAAQRVLGSTVIRVGAPPKSLLLYRAAAPFDRKLSSRKYQLPDTPKPSGVEILCTSKQQFVCFNVHPDTGKPYTWVADESPLTTPASTLPAVTASAIDEFLLEAEQILATAAGQEPEDQPKAPAQGSYQQQATWSLSAGKAALEVIELEDGDYDRWRNMGWALKALCGDEAFKIFHEWSSSQPGYDGESACREIWDSDKSGDGRRSIGGGTLIAEADRCAAALKEKDSSDPRAQAYKRAKDRQNKNQDDQKLAAATAALERDLVLVVDQNAYWSHSYRHLMQPFVIDHLYTSTLPLKNDRRPSPMEILRQSSTKTSVHSINYWPGKPPIFEDAGRRFVNTYVPHVIEPLMPTQQERETWNWFLARSFTGPDGPVFREWFVKLLALLVQRPGEKIPKAVLLHSPIAGNGKSTLALHIPKLLVGQHNVSEPRHAMIEGQFNSFFADAQVVHLDEIRFGGGRADAVKIIDNLKTPIDSETLVINAKYERPRQIRNCAWVTATSNRPDALPMDASERRWGVFEFTCAPLSLEERRRLFDNWLNSGRGPGTLKYLLMEVDLSDFDARSDPPQNEAKRAMQLVSEPLPIQVIRAALDGDSGTPLFDKDIVLASALAPFVDERCKYKVPPHTLGQLIAQSQLPFQKRRVRANGRQQRAYIIRRHEFWLDRTELECGRYIETGREPTESLPHQQTPIADDEAAASTK
jgi:hypothetical protein